MTEPRPDNIEELLLEVARDVRTLPLWMLSADIREIVRAERRAMAATDPRGKHCATCTCGDYDDD